MVVAGIHRTGNDYIVNQRHIRGIVYYVFQRRYDRSLTAESQLNGTDSGIGQCEISRFDYFAVQGPFQKSLLFARVLTDHRIRVVGGRRGTIDINIDFLFL